MFAVALVCCTYVFFIAPIAISEPIQILGSSDPSQMIVFIVYIAIIGITHNPLQYNEQLTVPRGQ